MMNNFFILFNLSQFGEFNVWFAPTASKSKARALCPAWIPIQTSVFNFHFQPGGTFSLTLPFIFWFPAIFICFLYVGFQPGEEAILNVLKTFTHFQPGTECPIRKIWTLTISLWEIGLATSKLKDLLTIILPDFCRLLNEMGL